MKLLLDKGADPNAEDKTATARSPRPPGHNLDVVKLLVAKGAAAEVQDGAGLPRSPMPPAIAVWSR